MGIQALAVLLVTLLAACRTPAMQPPGPSERVLIVGGVVYVGAPEWKRAQALYAEDGRIVAVGAESEVRSRARAPFTILDLGGGIAIPGLIDAHGHLEGLGKSLEEIDLRGVASYPELIAKVVAGASGLPPGTWIEGRGWDQNLWPEREFPHHAELSRALPDHPVVLSRVDGHAILVNAKALELAGRAGPQPGEHTVAGGRMLLDAEGHSTGVFVDNATGLIERRVPGPDEATRTRRMLRGAAELARNGLTGIHDMGEDREGAALLRRLSLAGRLPVEVAGYLSEDALAGLGERLPQELPLGGGGHYRLVGAKLYMDGALGSRGAALLEDYADEPGNRGLPMLDPARLDGLLARCDALGLQPAIHAIGDLANRRVLDAYQRRLEASTTFGGLLPRIEHAQVVAPEDWTRFAALGVTPSMQPTHATSDMPWAPARLGARRVEGAYAWRRLDPAGTALAFGSDCPVEKCDPLAGLHAAITCSGADGKPADGYRPDQRLDAARALAGFTRNAARAARQESDFGSLEPGKLANLTVLDLDPLACAPRDLLGASHVRWTIVRGRVAFAKE